MNNTLSYHDYLTSTIFDADDKIIVGRALKNRLLGSKPKANPAN